MTKTSVFTIGTDVEFFVKDSVKNTIISATDFVDGTKEKPIIMDNGAVLIHDNVSVEMATIPCKNFTSFKKQIVSSLKEVKEKYFKEEHVFVADTFTIMNKEVMVHPDCFIFGCDPDYDAWELDINEMGGIDPEKYMGRSVGGHLHVGATENSKYNFLLTFQGKIDFVKLADIFLSIPFVLIDKTPGSNKRRELYGKAGAHRPKEYGVEYRTLSNSWTTTNSSIEFVYRVTQEILNFIEKGIATKILESIDSKSVIECINTCNVDLALKIIKDVVSPNLSKKTSSMLDSLIKKPITDSDVFTKLNLN